MIIQEPKEAQRMARVRAICLRATAMSVGVCMMVALGIVAPAQAGSTFSVTNLITNDQSVNKAQITDPNLVNPWGVSFSSTSPVWVSDEGKGVSTLYSITANDQASIVTGPDFPVIIQGGGVTGQAFNGSSSAFNGDPFVFVTLGGAVEGWRPALGNTAEILSPANSANSYDGATLVTVNSNSYLLAANTATGNIDVFKGTSTQPGLSGNFTDPHLPAGFVPYNVQTLNGVVYVTYFDSATKSGGIVDAFSTSGNFLARVGAGGSLDQPWGLAIAPTSFGSLAGDLLVGNKASGQISIFNLTNDTALGTLTGTNGSPIVIQDLWALTIGNGASFGSTQQIYFTAGVGGYADGLVGAIQLASVPEPSTGVLGLIAVGALAGRWQWKKRRGVNS
jgi:uncharacterized protein (TIGR03118 family)